MRNPANPTRDEIRGWAFSSSDEEPDPAWELHLAHAKEYDLYVSFAADVNCPKAEYFLRLLYFIAGRLVHGGLDDRSRSDISSLLSCCAKHPRYVLHRFVQRTQALMQHPEEIIYEDWYAGRWVDNDMAAND